MGSKTKAEAARDALKSTTVPPPDPTPLQEAAASLVANTAPADPPSEAAVGTDWDFMMADPSDIKKYLTDAGLEHDPSKAYRWVNSDPRVFPKRKWAGWEPLVGKDGQIRRGDLIACHMPLARAEAQKAQIQRLAKQRRDAAFTKFDQDVKNAVGPGGEQIFQSFTGDKSLGDGM